jgi:hypothetical protein
VVINVHADSEHHISRCTCWHRFLLRQNSRRLAYLRFRISWAILPIPKEGAYCVKTHASRRKIHTTLTDILVAEMWKTKKGLISRVNRVMISSWTNNFFKIFINLCFWGMMQWLDEHPQYLSVQLFIGGNSYSGITVPHVTKKVIDGKIYSSLNLNLNFLATLKSNPLCL